MRKTGKMRTKRRLNTTIRKPRKIQKSKIITNFLMMLTTIKLYHWRTKSFAQHKATDELYAKLNENIDTFVEILLGKSSRIHLLDKKTKIVDCANLDNLKENIYKYREFLIGLSAVLCPRKDTDLLNVRDEILGDLNQFLYLLTFR